METLRSTVLLQQFLADPKNLAEFSKFARKYQSRIKRCCQARGLQDADAEDLAANLLLGFFARDVFDGFVFQTKVKFYAWLRTVVTNAVKTFVRDRGRKPDAWSVGNADAQEALQREPDKMVDDLETIFEDTRTHVEAARTRIKERVEEKTWLAFCLQMDEERPVHEVAERLGMSKVAVWQARSRILRKLRAELSDLHESDNDKK